MREPSLSALGLRSRLEGREGSPQGGQSGGDGEPLALTEYSQGAGQYSDAGNIRKRKWGAREKGGPRVTPGALLHIPPVVAGSQHPRDWSQDHLHFTGADTGAQQVQRLLKVR